jgi:hypothetical protein
MFVSSFVDCVVDPNHRRLDRLRRGLRSASVASVPMGHAAKKRSAAASSSLDSSSVDSGAVSPLPSEQVTFFRRLAFFFFRAARLRFSTTWGGWYNKEATYSDDALGMSLARLMSTECKMGGFRES